VLVSQYVEISRTERDQRDAHEQRCDEAQAEKVHEKPSIKGKNERMNEKATFWLARGMPAEPRGLDAGYAAKLRRQDDNFTSRGKKYRVKRPVERHPLFEDTFDSTGNPSKVGEERAWQGIR
jgi:hypothetical protein